MRILGRLLAVLLFAVAAAFVYQPLRLLFQPPPPTPAVAQQLDLKARPSTVYFLPQGDWLTFPVIGQAARLRILTHAGVEPEAERDVLLRYALEYQLLDSDMTPLHKGHYTQQTRVPTPRVKEGVPIVRNLYTDRALAVAAGQSFHVRLDGLARTAYVRLRLAPLSPPLKNVAVRVYYEERMSERQASVAWERLSRAQQQRLSRGALYPPELLTRQEQLNLLERQWQPVGPLGVHPAQDTLFNIEDAGVERDPRRMPPPGLYAGPDRLGIVPIKKAGRYRIHFKPLEDKAQKSELAFRYVTEQFEPPREERHRFDGESATVTRDLLPGLVVVTPNQPGMLDIRPVNAPEQSALPEPRFLRAWRVEAGQSVTFPLWQSDDVGTSLRFDLRAYADGVPLPKEKLLQAEYRLLDAEGSAVQQGRLESIVKPSSIDRMADTQPVADLSDPAHFYLRLPPEAASLEVAARQSLLVTAYTRPDDLPHRTRVPADYYAWQGDDKGQPSWFLLQPPKSRAATSPPRPVLHVQSRPPKRNPDLLAGRYQWEALEPQRAARGGRILMPVRGESRLRPQGLPGYFQPLTPGTQTIDLKAPGAARSLEPQLIYLRELSDPFRLALDIDGRTVRHERIGRRGEIDLPRLEPGRHTVTLHTRSAGTWLMNYRYPDRSGFLRRTAFRLDDTPLRYRVEKRTASQLFGARFYSLGRAGDASTVRVRVMPEARTAQVTQEWTHLERLYRVTPTAEQAGVGYVLDQQRERLAYPQPLLMDLGGDVPEGPVTVEFSLQQGAPGYLIFHEVLPGEHERAQGFREERQ